MAQQIIAPKGTRDFYPEDMAIREYIFTTWEKSCKKYGFEKFDAPLFESLELFTQKSGDEIEKQLYSFEDKGGRKIALRPEMTPSLARMVANKGMALKKPVRWYSIPRLFRYEKMQKGRLREFFQLNMDILGIDSTTADADLIAAAIGMMRDLKLDNNDFSVRVSSRDLLEELFLHTGVEKEKLPSLYALLDKLHKLPEDEFSRQLLETCGSEDMADKIGKVLKVKTLEDVRSINSELPSLKTLDELFTLLNAYGFSQYVEFDIGIVRGLAYYTGIVFELFDKKRSMRAIAGGGRYDKLVGLYGGPDTPAIGFAAGDVVLLDLLKEKGVLPELPGRSNIFVVTFDKSRPELAISTTQLMREAGFSAEYSLKPGNIGKQMKQADAAGSKVVIFVGGDEEAENKVKVKNMQNGNDELVDKSNLVNYISNII